MVRLLSRAARLQSPKTRNALCAVGISWISLNDGILRAGKVDGRRGGEDPVVGVSVGLYERDAGLVFSP